MWLLCRATKVRYTGTRYNVCSFSDSQIHQHSIKISLTEFSKIRNSEDISIRAGWRTCHAAFSVRVIQRQFLPLQWCVRLVFALPTIKLKFLSFLLLLILFHSFFLFLSLSSFPLIFFHPLFPVSVLTTIKGFLFLSV